MKKRKFQNLSTSSQTRALLLYIFMLIIASCNESKFCNNTLTNLELHGCTIQIPEGYDKIIDTMDAKIIYRWSDLYYMEYHHGSTSTLPRRSKYTKIDTLNEFLKVLIKAKTSDKKIFYLSFYKLDGKDSIKASPSNYLDSINNYVASRTSEFTFVDSNFFEDDKNEVNRFLREKEFTNFLSKWIMKQTKYNVYSFDFYFSKSCDKRMHEIVNSVRCTD